MTNDAFRSYLFKLFANRLVGHWHNFHNEDIYIFSLAEELNDYTPVSIQRKSKQLDALFQLGFESGGDMSLIIEDITGILKTTIKVLIDGMLILVSEDAHILIFERKGNPEFVDSLLDAL